MNASALVLNGQLASSLAAVRALHARGVRVIVGAPRKTALSLHSRAAAETFVYPDPKQDKDAFVACVARIADEEMVRTGLPVVPYFFSDSTFLPFVRADAAMRRAFAWNFASLDAIETVFDKHKTLLCAVRLNIPIPDERQIGSSKEPYPYIIKPRHSCIWPEAGEAVSGTAHRVFSDAEARACAERMRETTGEEPLVQACISGEEVGLFTVCEEGEAHGWFSHRRLLGIHPDGGASSIRESMDPPDALREMSAALLKEMNWSGPAMVEWKYDEATSVYRLMEINGRWWGSLPLALAADYPAVWMWYLLATGQKEVLKNLPHERSSVRAIHLLAAVKCVLTCIRLGRFREGMRALSLLGAPRGTRLREDVFLWKDPLPFFWEMMDVVARG